MGGSTVSCPVIRPAAASVIDVKTTIIIIIIVMRVASKIIPVLDGGVKGVASASSVRSAAAYCR